MLPKDLARLVPKSHLMTESEWRAIGVQQSRGWVSDQASGSLSTSEIEMAFRTFVLSSIEHDFHVHYQFKGSLHDSSARAKRFAIPTVSFICFKLSNDHQLI